MKYIYLILLTFFVACKPAPKPQEEQEEQITLLSDDEVKEIEALSKDDGKDRKFQDLSKDEQNKVKLLVNDLIDKNKYSLNKMLTLINKEAAEKGKKIHLEELIKKLKDDFIKDGDNPKEKIAHLQFLIVFMSIMESLENIENDLKAKMQILSETKDYAKINNVLNLGLNQTELDSIKAEYGKPVIYLNGKKVDFEEFM